MGFALASPSKIKCAVQLAVTFLNKTAFFYFQKYAHQIS